jgi:hypothetical protein
MELTETIPQRPQKSWLARVYFATESSNVSTSVSDGFSPDKQRKHLVTAHLSNVLERQTRVHPEVLTFSMFFWTEVSKSLALN